MNEKEFNLQILAKLIEIANYVFDNLLIIKDGVYTAAELYNQKDALGKNIVMSFSDVETHTVEVGTFKCSFKSDRIFFAVWKFEQLCKVKQSDKVRFNKGVDNKEIVKEKAMYYKSNGNDIVLRKKTLELHTENLSTDSKSIYYKIGDVWYDLRISYSNETMKRAIDVLAGNKNYFIEYFQKQIANNQYINSLEIAMCEALGIDKDAAMQSRKNCLKEREAERIERERIRLEQKERREEEERVKRENTIKDTEQKVLNNEKIDSKLFELLCEEHKIELSPKQKYCLREKIVSLNRDGYSYRNTKGNRTPKTDGIFVAYELLLEAIQVKYNPKDFISKEEWERLVNGEANLLDLSHENNTTDTTIPSDKEKQSEPTYNSENGILNNDSNYRISFEVDKHNFDIDFSGKLDSPCRINETFKDLIVYLNEETYHELARSELYERISRYAHGYFGSIGYVKRCELANIATDLLMNRITSGINIRDGT